MEALLWAMECMRNLREYQVTFTTDCSQLVEIVSEPTRRMASFCKLFGRYQNFQRKCPQIRDHLFTKNTKLKGGQPRTQCLEAIVFHRSHGCRSPDLVYRVSMNLYKLMTKKKYIYIYIYYIYIINDD